MDEKELFLTLVEKHAAAVEAEVKGVRKNRDIEYLHRMRVALRRLRSTMADFQDLLPSGDFDVAAANIKRLLRVLGQARDIDTKVMFLKGLADDPAAIKFRAGILEIIDELQEDRQEVQPKIAKHLAKIHRKQTFTSIRRLKPDLVATGMTLDEFAKNRVLARLEKLFSLEPFVRKPACVKELHQMRIAAKNLRYTLENFELLYGRKVRLFSDAAMKIQRTIGEVHNFDVWLGLLKILKDSSGRDVQFRRAVSYLTDECVRRRQEAYTRFLALWALQKRRKIWPKLSFFTLDRK